MKARFVCCDRVRERRDVASGLSSSTEASALKKAVLAEGSKEMSIWARREQHDDDDDVGDVVDGVIGDGALL